MTSILTGLAFMHGHIVDRELIQKLGREDAAERGKGAPRPAKASACKRDSAPACVVPAHPVCATC